MIEIFYLIFITNRWFNILSIPYKTQLAMMDCLLTSRQSPVSLIQDYLSFNWHITPLHGKNAYKQGWQEPGSPYRFLDALFSGDNIGLLHAYSGTMALDIDNIATTTTELASAGVDIHALLDAKDAVQVISGRAGRAKLIYKMPRGLVLPTKKIVVEGQTAYELRCGTSEGLTVQDMIPPSIHPDTKERLLWSGDWHNLPEIPVSLLDLWKRMLGTVDIHTVPVSLSGLDQKMWTVARVAEVLAHIPTNTSRDEWMDVCRALAHAGISQGNADRYKGVFDEWSARDTRRQKNGSPQYNRVELEFQWNDTVKRTPTQTRPITMDSIMMLARGNGYSGHVPTVAEEQIGNQFGAIVNRTECQLSVASGDDIIDSDEPVREWLVENVGFERTVGMFVANSGGGKTSMLADLAFHLATGRPWHGNEVKQNAYVLWVASEDDENVRQRIRAFNLKYHIRMPRFMLIQQQVIFDDDTDVAKLYQWLRRQTFKPDLIVIDTMRKSMKGEENSSTDTNKYFIACERIKQEFGSAVWSLHHTGKDGSMRGSTGISAALDFYYKGSKSDDGIARFTAEKMRGGVDKIELAFKLENWGTGKVRKNGTEIMATLGHLLADADANRIDGADVAIIEKMYQGETFDGLPSVGIMRAREVFKELGIGVNMLAHNVPDSWINKMISTHVLRAVMIGNKPMSYTVVDKNLAVKLAPKKPDA